MASLPDRTERSNPDASSPLVAISGRITLQQSERGVPDLVVEALHISDDAVVERLGSVCTDGLGDFRIEVESPAGDREKGGHRRRRSWDLQLAALAPERPGSDYSDRLLFRSEARERAGHAEHFRIELPADVLEAAGIALESPVDDAVGAVADGIAKAHARDARIQEAIDGVFDSRLETVEARRALFRGEVLKRLADGLSEVSEKERASDRFVPTAADIEAKHLESARTDVLNLTAKEAGGGDPVSRFRLTSSLFLTEEQKQTLTGGSDQPVTLTETDVQERLGVALDKPPAIYRRHLEPDPCRPRTGAESCMDDDEAGGIGGDDGHGDTPVVESVPGTDAGGNRAGDGVDFDRGKAVANVMRRQTAPEDPVEFGAEIEAGDVALEQPLTAGGVSDAIHQVVFAPGPADVPAFYDFHDLQIAFEPVWQEALDDKFLEDVETAYDRFVERGGAPALSRISGIVAANPGPGFFSAFMDGLFDIGTAAEDEVPSAVAIMVPISLEEWRVLAPPSRRHLAKLAARVADLREDLLAAIDPDKIPDISFLNLAELVRAANTREAIAIRAQIRLLRTDAERIVAHARRLILEREADEPFRPTHAIIEQLRHRRRQGFPFRYFAASPRHRSVNFGLVVTYRQKWEPVSYQVGELVSTVPLGPKEIRRYSQRTVVKTRRSQKEVESNLVSRRGESEEKSRAEAQIVARAQARTNFSLSNSGTVNIGGDTIGGSATTTSAFSREAQRHSESIKKEFREAIIKSAEEYKNERRIEVSSEESFEEEITQSGEIQNPNDEIPVTFLFYELQRRFKVSEKIHRLQSVVLVAQEVPSPSAINKAWIIRHDWILNRVLLDDSFRPALTYISTSLVSEATALKEMRQALFRQRKLVEELKEDLADRRALAGLRYAALQRQIERTAESAGSGGGLLGGLGDLVGGIPLAGDLIQGGLDLITGGGDGPSEEAQIREGAARDAFDRERREEQDLASRAESALSTLDAMQRGYTERLAQHLGQLTQCERLLTHLSQNILHYMQAIWAHEPDDQRFLRLRNVPVPVFEKDKGLRRYELDPTPLKAFSHITRPAGQNYEVAVDLGITRPPDTAEEIETRPLSEVADLDRPLGFKGNYMIFPLVESNPITEFMMDPYVTFAAGEYGIADPDPLGNLTLEEFSEYVCCLKKHFEEQGQANGDGDDAEPAVDPFEELKPFLRETLKRLLELSLRDDEEIVVPCDCLYIEALPGAHSVMEKFKHLHRQLDVKQAQSELRSSELESIRRAARILGDELEDPQIEAKYVFEGGGSATVVPPGDPGAGGS